MEGTTKIALLGIVLIVLAAIVIGGLVKVDYTNVALTGIGALGGYVGSEVKHALENKTPGKPNLS